MASSQSSSQNAKQDDANTAQTWDQCRPELIKHLPTGKRVLASAKHWAVGKKKFYANDPSCVYDFGTAIHLDILGASFFADLIPNGDGGPGDTLQKYLAEAIDGDSEANPRSDKERVLPLITRAYITFLLTSTPQLRIYNLDEGSRIVRLAADKAVKCDPEDPRLRVMRSGFMSQLGGDRAKLACVVDARKAVELAEASIVALENDPGSYKADRGASDADANGGGKKKNGRKNKKTTCQSTGPDGREFTPEALEKLSWSRLQKAHANLQLGDLNWAADKTNPEERRLAEGYLKVYIENSSDCDPDMHSACFKLAISTICNIPNPKKVRIVPDLVRSNLDKIQTAIEWYRRGLDAEGTHHRWLPAGMDEKTGPLARTWLKLISRSLAVAPAIKPNPVVPHPGSLCENQKCPNKGVTPDGSKAGMCPRCLWANYCCRDCQVADWKEHKQGPCKEGLGVDKINADGQFVRS